MLSAFTAQSANTPSSCGVKTTSEGMPRTVVVSGATATPLKNGITELRVKISTGRR